MLRTSPQRWAKAPVPGRELPGGRRAPARLRPVCSLGVSSSEPSSWSRPFTLKVLGCGIFLSSLFFLFSVFKISAETEIRHGLPRVFTRGGATHSQSFHPRQTPQGLTCCGVDGRVYTRRGDSGLHGAANVSHLWERLWCPWTRGHQQGRLPEGCLGLARGGPGSGAASGGSSGGERRHSLQAGAPGARDTDVSGLSMQAPPGSPSGLCCRCHHLSFCACAAPLEVRVGAAEVGSCCRGFEGVLRLHLQDTEDSRRCENFS